MPDQRPASGSGLHTAVTAVAAGLAVALAVLVVFAVRFFAPTTSAAAANAGPEPARSQAGTATRPSPAAEPGAGRPAEPDRPGQDSPGQNAPGQNAPANTPRPARPGAPADGVQLWTKAPLAGIHQDQGSSIALPDGRTLWIFADTFQLTSEPRFFLTSSAGVTEPGGWQLRYAQTGARPTEFLPRTAAERADRVTHEHYQAVWPTGSTLLPDGRIIISYAKYRVLPKQDDYQFLGAGLFEFRYRGPGALTAGGHARRIANDVWTADDGEVRSPVYAGGHVYFNQCRDLRCQALRTTPAGLTDRASYRWWTGAGWSANRYRAQDLVVASSHPGGNASVVRLRTGGYAMADTEVGSVAGRGLLWVAPDPWGPWSRAAEFDFPRCPASGCYGLNLHPSASSADRLRVSYATNGVGPFVRVADIPVWISADHTSILVR